MRKATRIVASSLGIFAGFGGPEHGVFEIMRGNVRPEGVMIASMGPRVDAVTLATPSRCGTPANPL